MNKTIISKENIELEFGQHYKENRHQKKIMKVYITDKSSNIQWEARCRLDKEGKVTWEFLNYKDAPINAQEINEKVVEMMSDEEIKKIFSTRIKRASLLAD